MAVVSIYGAKVRNLENAFPPLAAFSGYYAGRVRTLFDYATFANTDSIASKCFLGRIPSAAVVLPQSTIYFGAFGAGCTLNIGNVNAAAGLATVIDVSAAGSSMLLEAMTSANTRKQLWEHLGYTSDPDTKLDLYATIAGAAVSTATAYLTWSILWAND